jgi:anionic cell wall polymer biosynthesis LytR-Cps2A-Psr (LCP) family protein
MRRQRCLIDAVIDRANPGTLLTRYEKILEAGRDVLRTDIPGEMLPAFVDLSYMVKDAKVRSVVFERSDDFTPESPDYAWIQRVVAKATSPGDGAGGGNGGGGGAKSAIDSAESSCTYDPVG